MDSQRAQLAQLAGKGRLDAALAEAASARLSAVSELAELAGCALVIEAIVEQLEAKQALFRQLETIVGDDALLASNTSSISLTAIAAPLTRPQRLAGLHFQSGARMALVEVIAGLATAPEVIDTLMATARAWGKTPVRQIHAGLYRQPGGAAVLRRGAAPGAGRRSQPGHAGCAIARGGRFSHGAVRADGHDRPRRQLCRHLVGVARLFS